MSNAPPHAHARRQRSDQVGAVERRLASLSPHLRLTQATRPPGHAPSPNRRARPTSSRVWPPRAFVPALSGAILTVGSVAAQEPNPSTLVQRAFCKPVFFVNDVRHAAGSGFLLETLNGRRRTYLFTAQHLFSVPADQMNVLARSAACKPPTGTTTFVTGAAVRIRGAHPMGPPRSFKDVAVFPVIGRSPGLPLASRDVAPGDPVWLLAQPASGVATPGLLHRAWVLRTQGFLAFRYDDQSLGPDQTSGAALINAAGEVVGLNVGYTRSSSGELIGVGDRLAVLQAVVADLPQSFLPASSSD